MHFKCIYTISYCELSLGSFATASNIIVGSQVWVEDNEVAWIDGDVLEMNDKEIKVKCSNGQEVVTNVSRVYPKDPEASECGVDDMTKLAYLHEPGVLQNLKSRFDMNEIYTYTGNILIAVNPFQRLPHYYEKEVMKKYKGVNLGDLNPHPYAIADAAYRHFFFLLILMQMVNEGISQSILVSGESGAGKTEASKNLMQYLAYMGGRPGADGRSVEQQVLESNPVLEAFGNAKTVRNNNSSRFGKFVEIQFNGQGKISGAAIRTYLLERSRVCQVSDPERSYHCFYMLCAAPPEVCEKYKLGNPRTFRYLNQSKCYELDGLDEAKEYLSTIKAMDVVGISSEEQEAIFRVVAAILHLGNIEFTRGSEPDSSQPKDDKSRSHLKTAAELFMCDETALQESFCKRVIVTRGESITKSLDPNSAALNRDALAKIVYSRLFDWIVSKINNSIGQDPNSKFLIGVLDIYGFESFKSNSFEQFCINLTNEKLQQHFNQHVFKMEQELYTKEEINWSYIEFVDNQDILDLIEKKPGGILALLDEACMFPRSTHITFAEKLYQTFKGHKRFSKPKLAKTDFTICHYAGDVTYQTDFFLDKNKDYVVAEHQALLSASKCSFVSGLFPPLPEDSSKASKFISIGSRFKQQLQALLETLSHTEPHYVRCVKPNNVLKPNIFENQNILQQLRCGGVMEAIRISCAGFPTRKPFHEFIERFEILSPDVVHMSDEVEASKILLEKANLEGYQIGKTKVFLRAGQMAEIDARRSEVLGRSASKIQNKFLSYSACKKFTMLRSAAIPLQAFCRGEVARSWYQRRRREVACLRIQKIGRMHYDRKAYKFLHSSAIQIQNGMRGMAARKAYNHKRQTKAAIGIQTRSRHHLACRRYLKMKKVAIYAQSVLRRDLARIELRNLKKAAKDTRALEQSKAKLEREHKELTIRLEQEERMRAEAEEAKNKEKAILESSLKEMKSQLAEVEEAKKKESEQMQSALKAVEVQLAEVEEVKKKESEQMQSALKAVEVQLAEVEEAKSTEIANLQTTLKDAETQLADLEEAKTKETTQLQSALKDVEEKFVEMEEAKNKDIANLHSTLKETEVQLEAKNKESAKLQSDLQEMEVQVQETKELLESKKIELEQLLATHNEKVESLTADNVKFQEKVSTLEQEINETQTKLEETTKLSEDRLKEAMEAENRIIDIKIDMQSLQEKIADMEAEEEILRHKQQRNGGPSKEFDSNLTNSTIGKERDLVDALMKAATQELGFSQGKPVATYVIYKSLLHWKTFELEITTVFDRIIQTIGSSIEKKEDIKHMAYWLSFTSTLFFLIQKTLSPAPHKPQQPTSLFGRMTQGFRSASIISIVHHVEAKYPALLFKKQLAVYVEKLYGFIRNSLKKDLSHFLSSCIQAPITSDGKSYPTSYWESIIESLNGVLDTLKEFHVPPVIIQKVFAQVYSFIDVQLFNSLLMHKECCTLGNGEYVKSGLAKLEAWCTKATAEYADSASDELQRVRQAVGFLVIEKKSKITYDQLTTNICPVLSIQQIHKICTFYANDNEGSNSVPPEFKVLMHEDTESPDSDSYLLDDNSSTSFPIEEISKSINEKGFSDMKPPNELLENPEFQFLKE
uniref:Myosin motor domain-containing protein n=1 Tax=Lactuca sativa TaxID=4236 RepID=A0A9R1XXY9_LACSA|nr:hypothetical protein LSAT_V11C100029560 [Lactuca sativa]